MKLPFRFTSLSKDEIKEILSRLKVYGLIEGPFNTEKHTLFFLYPSDDENKTPVIHAYLSTIGYKEKLVIN